MYRDFQLYGGAPLKTAKINFTGLFVEADACELDAGENHRLSSADRRCRTRKPLTIDDCKHGRQYFNAASRASREFRSRSSQSPEMVQFSRLLAVVPGEHLGRDFTMVSTASLYMFGPARFSIGRRDGVEGGRAALRLWHFFLVAAPMAWSAWMHPRLQWRMFGAAVGASDENCGKQ